MTNKAKTDVAKKIIADAEVLRVASDPVDDIEEYVVVNGHDDYNLNLCPTDKKGQAGKDEIRK